MKNGNRKTELKTSVIKNEYQDQNVNPSTEVCYSSLLDFLNFRMLLNFKRNCKDSTERSHMFQTQFLLLTSYMSMVLSSQQMKDIDTETFSSVQSLSHVRLFATPWTAARQASLSITDSQSLLKRVSIESVMPSNHLILLSPSPPTFSLSQHQGLFK